MPFRATVAVLASGAHQAPLEALLAALQIELAGTAPDAGCDLRLWCDDCAPQPGGEVPVVRIRHGAPSAADWEAAADVIPASAPAHELKRRVETQASLAALRREERNVVRARSGLLCAFDPMPVPILIVRGAELVLEYANAAGLAVLRKDPSVLGRPLLQGLPELVGQGFDGLLHEVQRTGVPFIGREVRALLAPAAGGLDQLFVTFGFSRIENWLGLGDGVLIAGIDLSEQVNVRTCLEAAQGELMLSMQEVQQSETRFRTLVHTVSTIVWTADASFEHSSSGGGWEAFTGQPDGVENAWGWLESVHPDDRAPARQTCREAARTGEILHGEFRMRRRDGEYALMEARGVPVRSADGTILEWVGVTNDITAQRQLQERLQASERLSSLGTLAAGVAHEINNPISFVRSNLQFIVESVTEGLAAGSARGGGLDVAELLSAAQDALEGANRVCRIAADFKLYSRAQTDEIGQLDVNAAVQTAVGLTSAQLKHRAQVSCRLGLVPLVRGNEGRLVQVLVNLLVNAAQAIPEGAPERNRVSVWTGPGPDGRVAICVQDTGSGMTSEVRRRIFEPYFTTKPLGVGTGLGLSISHALISKQGGEISVESEPGVGTTFTLLLPVAVAQAQVQEAPLQSGPAVAA